MKAALHLRIKVIEAVTNFRRIFLKCILIKFGKVSL